MAAMVEERLAGVAIHTFHLAQEDGVIARGIVSANIAGKMSKRVINQWNACGGPPKLDAEGFCGFVILQRFCKVFRHSLLRVFQDVDAKAALFFEEG